MMRTIDEMKPPTRKPNLDHKTFLAVVRAHMEKRHVTCKNYWSTICPVCWRQVTQ